MIRLDAATVLLQWATGGLFFLWITTRRRELGIGYGWLLRSVYAVLAVGAFIAGRLVRPDVVRDTCALATAGAAGVALVVSILRRKAGVSGQRLERQRKAARVAAMVGNASDAEPQGAGVEAVEFPPWLDLVAPVIGSLGLVAAALAAGGPHALALTRTLVGSAFLGSVTDAMLLGHWYLVQPGLGRAPIFELIRWLTVLWPIEVAVLIWPTGMLSVLSGSVDDGWNGTLGWFWVACAVATVVLVFVTKAALKEKEYSAVMAATGLLYLAILTAFGTDLVARAVLSPTASRHSTSPAAWTPATTPSALVTPRNPAELQFANHLGASGAKTFVQVVDLPAENPVLHRVGHSRQTTRGLQ